MPPTLTNWTALLAHAVALAQTSAVWPKNLEGDRLRAAVPAVIGLQALTLALDAIDALPGSERGIGIDRASVLLTTHAATLHNLWRAEPLPDSLAELLADARRALKTAANSGLLLVVGESAAGPSASSAPMVLAAPERVAQSLLDAGFTGTLWLSGPAVAAGPNCPIAFIRGPRGGRPESKFLDLLERAILSEASGRTGVGKPLEEGRTTLYQVPVPGRIQVYRSREGVTDDIRNGGNPVSSENTGPLVDTLTWFDEALPIGRPLLAPVIEAGQLLPAPNPILFAGLAEAAREIRGTTADSQ